MTYKNALAGLDHGGGKAVIVGDPAATRSPTLLHAYGRFVALARRPVRHRRRRRCTVADMDVIGEENPWTTGRSPENGGGGDSGVLTALRGLPGAAGLRRARLGRADDLRRAARRGRRRRQGRRAAGRACSPTPGPPSSWPTSTPTPSRGCGPSSPGVDAVDARGRSAGRTSTRTRPAPSAARSPTTVVGRLTARVVCGGANNQLAHPGVGRRWPSGASLYAPDFLVNCGGVIQVADELHGFSTSSGPGRARPASSTRPCEVLALARPRASPRSPPPSGWPRRGSPQGT